MFQMKVPKPFWANLISTTNFLINHMPSSVFSGEIYSIVLFPTKTLFLVKSKVFGSTGYAHDVQPHLTKLDPKAFECAFRGHSWLQKEYQCYSPNLHKYLVSTNMAFSKQIQNVLSQSSAKSEYRVISQSMCEIMWIHHMLAEIGMEHSSPTNFVLIIMSLFLSP